MICILVAESAKGPSDGEPADRVSWVKALDMMVVRKKARALVTALNNK